ncbi:hypothetical protein ACWFMI_23370 [Nocardiopsis terrae]|uniref:hypothetical protein n=1 Tax=Streptomyces sp. NPDC057554 TaxID=3350538 RepID=UPI0036B2A621
MNDPTVQVNGRRGQNQVNLALDLLILFTRDHSPACLADQIARRGIIGRADSANDSPVGQWVLAQMGELHRAKELAFVAHTFSWRGWLAVYDPAGRLIGEVAIPITHPLYALECQINDLGRPALVHRGLGDPR